MSDHVPFYLTRGGRQFYEHTVPALVQAVERLADRVASREMRELVDHAAQLAAAAEQVLETEIVPGSDATVTAFRELRRTVRSVRDVMGRMAG